MQAMQRKPISQPEFENLFRIGQLKDQPPNTPEATRMLKAARSLCALLLLCPRTADYLPWSPIR